MDVTANLELDASVTQIDGYAFFNVENLKSITGANVTTMDNYAFKSSGVESISFAAIVNGMGTGCFNYCTSLTTIDLPVLGTAKSTLFNGCTSLTTVELPEVETIHTSVFHGCTSLTEVVLGDDTISSIYLENFNLASEFMSTDIAKNVDLVVNCTYKFECNNSGITISGNTMTMTTTIGGEETLTFKSITGTYVD